MRSRQSQGIKLILSAVWDQVCAGYLATSGAGVDDVNKAIQLLTDTKPARVFMAQVRQALADQNGRGGQAQGGRKGPVEDMGVAEMHQELAEARNTIYQLRKNQEPFKR